MKNSKNKAYRRHLAVIRLSAMGDVAMVVPVLKTFVKSYPKVKLTVVTKSSFTPLFESIPNLQMLAVDTQGEHKGLGGIRKIFNSLKKKEIDAVADLHQVLRSNILTFFFRLAGIPVEQIDKGRAEKKLLIRKKNKFFHPLKSTHIRYADVFERLGFPLHLSKDIWENPPPLTPSIKNVVGSFADKILIGIAPFATYEGKSYPLELMEEVIIQLEKENRYKIMLFGGGIVEKKRLEPIVKKFDCCISVVQKLDFKEELILISNLKLMVAMDSSNAHIAANFGIPVITLWGVTHPYAGFYPYGQPLSHAILVDRTLYPLIPTSVYGNKSPKGYEKVMHNIRPEKVLQKIKEVLLEEEINCCIPVTNTTFD